MIRNAFEAPAKLEPLRRWTRTPNFYVNTFNPKTGLPLIDAETSMVIQTHITFSAAETLHAAVAYQRPPGNLDADQDPASYMAPTADADAPIVVCRRR